MTTTSDKDLLELDLYHLLDPTDTLTASSPPTDISRHYRKQARLLHPDKNPNNPKAAEQFDTLQRAYELLTDDTKRTDYNDRRRKREEKKRKLNEEDVRVRLMRQRLEEREAAGKTAWDGNKRHMQAARIQRENEAVMQQLRQHTPQPPQPAPQRTEWSRQQRTAVEAEGSGNGDGGRQSGAVGGTAAGAGLDMKAYETSTLERMREMARRRKEERAKQQQTTGAANFHLVDGGGGAEASPSSQRESEVIVLDGASSAIT